MNSYRTPHWSSQLAVYLGTVGAAVGLGSIWRFPYLVGTLGGGVFIIAFVLACLLIATPLLVAEYMIGRYSGLPPPSSPGAFAAGIGGSQRWNIIGQLGTLTAFLIASYYTIISGWVVAYAWKSARGEPAGLPRPELQAHFKALLASPYELMGWQIAFIALVTVISARGLGPGIELASRVRAPALLLLLLLLDGYSLASGDVAGAAHFVFDVHLRAVTPEVILAAIGQAFFATGVGMAMMLAYGAYMQRGASLVRPALVVSGSILLVSLLATVLVFPLVFRFHMDPAGGPPLVFDVLPTAFAFMPGGRWIGTVFFVLLILAALTPTLATFEPMIAWLQARGMRRVSAALITATAAWITGLGSLLSFNLLADWHPLQALPIFSGKTIFEVVDFIASNVFLVSGAFLTCLLVGWRLDRVTFDAQMGNPLGDPSGDVSRAVPRLVVAVCRALLRYLCPAAIAAVTAAAVWKQRG